MLEESISLLVILVLNYCIWLKPLHISKVVQCLGLKQLQLLLNFEEQLEQFPGAFNYHKAVAVVLPNIALRVVDAHEFVVDAVLEKVQRRNDLPQLLDIFLWLGFIVLDAGFVLLHLGVDQLSDVVPVREEFLVLFDVVAVRLVAGDELEPDFLLRLPDLLERGVDGVQQEEIALLVEYARQVEVLLNVLEFDVAQFLREVLGQEIVIHVIAEGDYLFHMAPRAEPSLWVA